MSQRHNRACGGLPPSGGGFNSKRRARRPVVAKPASVGKSEKRATLAAVVLAAVRRAATCLSKTWIGAPEHADRQGVSS